MWEVKGGKNCLLCGNKFWKTRDPNTNICSACLADEEEENEFLSLKGATITEVIIDDRSDRLYRLVLSNGTQLVAENGEYGGNDISIIRKGDSDYYVG